VKGRGRTDGDFRGISRKAAVPVLVSDNRDQLTDDLARMQAIPEVKAAIDVRSEQRPPLRPLSCRRNGKTIDFRQKHRQILYRSR